MIYSFGEERSKVSEDTPLLPPNTLNLKFLSLHQRTQSLSATSNETNPCDQKDPSESSCYVAKNLSVNHKSYRYDNQYRSGC